MVLSACTPVETTAPAASPPPKIVLTPYRTATLTTTAAPLQEATATPLPPPSPTPRIHTVIAGETLLQIAFLYGLNYESILSANPSISPSMLSVGAQLVIPEGSEPSPAGVVFTPQPLTLVEQPCYDTMEGGAWCLALVRNESLEGVEGVALEMRLLNTEGEQINGKLVPAPLNVLPSGGSLPVGFYFPPPLPDTYHLQADLKHAFPYAGDSRYLPVTLVHEEPALSENGLQAVIKGSVMVENPESMARLSVLAAAYGMGGELLGMRLWQQVFPVEAGGDTPFEMIVYSLAGEIAGVEVMAEAEAR